MTHSPPFLSLSSDIVAIIFDYVDIDEGYGRCTLALTCKALAAAAKIVKVNRTPRFMTYLYRPKGKRWCDGCGYLREVDPNYWREHEEVLWTLWGFSRCEEAASVAWEAWYERYIHSWNSAMWKTSPKRSWHADQLNRHSKHIAAGLRCPACQAQLDWEMEVWGKLRYTNNHASWEIKEMMDVETRLLWELRRRGLEQISIFEFPNRCTRKLLIVDTTSRG